ncbi:outer membrane-specific lipoprotein transporter subunit; ATP-binding component of ABC superfamily [Candidatus Terasakiella magnetica]|uniref:Outer membrane-specific lipoprotein transporter subunit ATP-binding component of ABC superfamily n=1 Tax=Candidatus Terasakiella magnetica TaxID=1867952 RepID=A0A1C3RCR6_9PROT|nr:ABC transporter ATP-binding protein [Candidatus Terasakiella magnetica]SCA55012.1 outer membrane-specific lipoprotein transporter subunit; ATP-binding component of ABC superfamily [Candidatus Terasakiella magnetica]
MSKAVLELQKLCRTFKQGTDTLHILKESDLIINQGEIVALVGPSGAGKSTLLQTAGLLEKPDTGTIRIGGTDTSKLSDKELTRLRCNHLGFVYQYHHLLPEFSASENIVIPQMINGKSKAEANVRAQELLEAVSLSKRDEHRPAELSGGEQQRIAIARALANKPKLLLADEPTGNLDPVTSDHVFNLLLEEVRKEGLAALIATHNPTLAKRMDRVVKLEDGHLIEQ